MDMVSAIEKVSSDRDKLVAYRREWRPSNLWSVGLDACKPYVLVWRAHQTGQQASPVTMAEIDVLADDWEVCAISSTLEEQLEASSDNKKKHKGNA